MSQELLAEIAAEAYVYLYPLVLLDITRLKLCRVMNQWQPSRAYPPGSFRGVIRPNFDTLYSIAWLDLTEGPIMITVPDTAGRYYCMHMMDMWTESFAVPGSRTWGTGANACVVIGPKDSEDAAIAAAPQGAAVLRSSTAYVWIINRIQTNGVSDYKAVHALQDGFGLSRLGNGGPRLEKSQDERTDNRRPPAIIVRDMPAQKFFEYAARLLVLHPPATTDGSTVLRLRSVGLRQGQYGGFDWGSLPAATQLAMVDGAAAAFKSMRAGDGLSSDKFFNGWELPVKGIGNYGIDYMSRAKVAMVGVGAVPVADACYSNSLGGRKAFRSDCEYEIRFAGDDMPPCDAFWSLTLYDPEGYPTENPMKKYAVGVDVSTNTPVGRDGLIIEGDGSVVIHISRNSPGPHREANWLPAPQQNERFVLSGRFYAPRRAMLEQRWSPPEVRQVGVAGISNNAAAVKRANL